MDRSFINKVKTKLKKSLRITKTERYKYQCSVCGERVQKYLPLSDSYREKSLKYGYKFFGQNEHLNKEKYSCPFCKGSDRDRFYAAFFQRIEKIPKNSELLLLDIAPSWALCKNYIKHHFVAVTADLMMPGVDYVQDIEDMKAFKNDYFGYLICSHVLEHVNNPDIALKELFRVLKPGGKAILMVPIIPAITETIEDPNHVTEEERFKHYGQEDHLRLFARQDFVGRIKKAGFNVKTYDIKDFGKSTFRKLGLKNSSVLYLGVKADD